MFNLTEQDHERISAWRKEQDALVTAAQAKSEDKFIQENGGSGIPYYGAIGGELTYSFTPTSLGTVVKVEHALTKNILDLSDYDSW